MRAVENGQTKGSQDDDDKRDMEAQERQAVFDHTVQGQQSQSEGDTSHDRVIDAKGPLQMGLFFAQNEEGDHAEAIHEYGSEDGEDNEGDSRSHFLKMKLM